MRFIKKIPKTKSKIKKTTIIMTIVISLIFLIIIMDIFISINSNQEYNIEDFNLSKFEYPERIEANNIMESFLYELPPTTYEKDYKILLDINNITSPYDVYREPTMTKKATYGEIKVFNKTMKKIFFPNQGFEEETKYWNIVKGNAKIIENEQCFSGKCLEVIYDQTNPYTIITSDPVNISSKSVYNTTMMVKCINCPQNSVYIGINRLFQGEEWGQGRGIYVLNNSNEFQKITILVPTRKYAEAATFLIRANVEWANFGQGYHFIIDYDDTDTNELNSTT